MASRQSVAEKSPSNGRNRALAARLEEFHNLPILFEDDPDWDMGEADLHAVLEHILRYGIEARSRAGPPERPPDPAEGQEETLNAGASPALLRRRIGEDIKVNRASTLRSRERPRSPVSSDDLPILYEDEEDFDLGESNPHVDTNEIIHVCVKAHLKEQPQYQVFADMNCHYRKGPRHKKTGSLPYFSPDVMIVEPFQPLPETTSSYTIGQDGPPPVVAVEVLSKRSAQQRDLKEKRIVYEKLGVPEHILVDPSGRYLKKRLLLKRLDEDGRYRDENDADGGVTCRLGFRIIIDRDGRVRVLDAGTGRPYVRPDEAEEQARALREAQERIRRLEAELQKPAKKRSEG